MCAYAKRPPCGVPYSLIFYSHPVISVFTGFVSWLVCVLVWCLLYVIFIEPPEREQVSSQEIALMTDGSTVSGRVSMFGGRIETQTVYYYYVDQGDGGSVLRHKNANLSVIYQDSDTPYVTSWCRPQEWDLWGPPMHDRDCRYEFHVPEGTIGQNPQLDGP